MLPRLLISRNSSSYWGFHGDKNVFLAQRINRMDTRLQTPTLSFLYASNGCLVSPNGIWTLYNSCPFAGPLRPTSAAQRLQSALCSDQSFF